MDHLEAECSLLQNLALNLHKKSLLVASNKELESFSQVEMKEKNIIHHFNELMDIEKQHSPHQKLDRRRSIFFMLLIEFLILENTL
jgi:hypothetical protein